MSMWTKFFSQMEAEHGIAMTFLIMGIIFLIWLFRSERCERRKERDKNEEVWKAYGKMHKESTEVLGGIKQNYRG